MIPHKKKGKKPMKPATLDRAQVAALLQVKDEKWERQREEWQRKADEHERYEAEYKRREQQWETERAKLFDMLRIDHAKMNKIRLRAFCREVELYICSCYCSQTHIQVAYLDEIESHWLDNFLAAHHLPHNVVEFLCAQRKVGSNIAHPEVHGKEIQNILQAYLTLDFSVRERYNVLFAFYFGAHNIDYQSTLTALMSDSNNNN